MARWMPTDSDVDLHAPRQRLELRRAPWSVLGVIASGGALGAAARYELGVVFPTAPPGFPSVARTPHPARRTRRDGPCITALSTG